MPPTKDRFSALSIPFPIDESFNSDQEPGGSLSRSTLEDGTKFAFPLPRTGGTPFLGGDCFGFTFDLIKA